MSCGRIITRKEIKPVVITRLERTRALQRDGSRAATSTRVARAVDVVHERQVLVRNNVSREVQIIRQGIQGPRGFPGGSIPPIHFAYGDAGSIVYTDEAPGTYTRIRIDITTPFDGTDPRIIVGTAADHDVLMGADGNDPLTEAGFEVTTDLHVAGATGVWLEVSAPGAAQGAGVLYLEFLPD